MSRDEALALAETLSLDEICAHADKVRTHFLGRKVDTCSIMNARSGRCSENCKWCAQSAHYSTGCEVYGYVSAESALEHAEFFRKKGVRRFSLVTSGRTVSDADIQKLYDAFAKIRDIGGIELCGSFGLLNKRQFERLAESGMTRFHCNLETAPVLLPDTLHHAYDRGQDILHQRGAGGGHEHLQRRNNRHGRVFCAARGACGHSRRPRG